MSQEGHSVTRRALPGFHRTAPPIVNEGENVVVCQLIFQHSLRQVPYDQLWFAVVNTSDIVANELR